MKYRRTPMDVSKLNEKLRKIKKEIKDIQEKCPHKEQEIKFINQRGVMRVCKYCELPVGWPSTDEEKNWLK
jgi:DNA-binding protein YbaB